MITLTVIVLAIVAGWGIIRAWNWVAGSVAKPSSRKSIETALLP